MTFGYFLQKKVIAEFIEDFSEYSTSTSTREKVVILRPEKHGNERILGR